MINFDSNIPYYIQLIEILREKIQAGVWSAGDRLPSEPELCDIYSVSRTVVRQALKEIELEGIITRRKGKGTFISEPKINESLAQKLTGFYQDMVERGLVPVTKVLRQEIVAANTKVAEYLDIDPGTLVFEITRLRFVNDVPVILVTTYLPYELCPQLEDAELSDESLYAFLEKECGLFIESGRRFIEAVATNEIESKLLEVEVGAPSVQLDSVSYLEDGTPIEYFHALHRGDRSRFEVNLHRVKEHVSSGGINKPFEKGLPLSN
jgi:GntR family transcriptional regulator